MSVNSRARVLDGAAIGVSGLCLIHCLALPLLAAVSPLAGLAAEAEWAHAALVVIAIPISGLVILRHGGSSRDVVFPTLAIVGLSLLCAAAFVEPLHDHETPLTAAGALILASSHLWRWARHTYRNQAKGPRA